MNLSKAAEIVRRHNQMCDLRKYPTDEEFDIARQASYLLEKTMLEWLDPTPISEEWLRENGWEKFGFWYLQNLELHQSVKGDGWHVLEPVKSRVSMSLRTLGELRTLLRLCGESATNKENDA